MRYVIHYSIGSAMFLLITAAFYFRQKRVPNERDQIYSAMLIGSFFACVFDAIGAGLEPYGLQVPIWVLYVSNMVFLLSMHLCLPGICFYLLAYAGKLNQMTTLRKLALLLPFAVIVLLTLSAPLWKGGIFYIDETHLYCKGATHSLLYFVSTIYMILTLLILTRSRNLIRRSIRVTVILFLGVLLIGIGIQLLFPQYLVTTSATALAVCTIYYIMQSPSTNIDPLTNSFNRMAMPSLLRSAFDDKANFTLMTISLRTLNRINEAYGSTTGEKLLGDFAKYLNKAFPKQYVFHLYYTQFVVMFFGDAHTNEYFRTFAGELPKFWTVDRTTVELPMDICVLRGADFTEETQMMNIIDYILLEELRTGTMEPLFIGEEIYTKYRRSAMLEAALPSLLEQGSLRIRFLPLVDAQTGRMIGLEALPQINGEGFGTVHTDELMHVAEQTGKIRALTFETLEAVCDLLAKENTAKARGIDFVLVRLSLVMLMHRSTAEEIVRLIKSSGISPTQLHFAVEESESTAQYSMVRDAIRSLRQEGFSFLMDKFGVGYSNMSVFSELPMSAVRFDANILNTLNQNERHEPFLRGLNELLGNMGLATVCPHVNTDADLRAADRLGIRFRQGEKYGEALDA